MPKYIASEAIAHFEPQQQLADGRWTPISRVVEMDTDAGFAVVLQAQGDQLVLGAGGQPVRQRVHGAFRMVGPGGEVNPGPDAPVAAQPAPAVETAHRAVAVAIPESHAESAPEAETATATQPVQQSRVTAS